MRRSQYLPPDQPGAVIKKDDDIWVVTWTRQGYCARPFSPLSRAQDGLLFCDFGVIDELGFEVLHTQGLMDQGLELSPIELDQIFRAQGHQQPEFGD
ncbi:MAG: hypothetical protein AAF449_03355 [Myxococcota bacterium]